MPRGVVRDRQSRLLSKAKRKRSSGPGTLEELHLVDLAVGIGVVAVRTFPLATIITSPAFVADAAVYSIRIPRVAVVGVRTVQAGVRIAIARGEQRHLAHRRAPPVLVALVRQPAGALNKFAGVAREGYRARALALRRVARARATAYLEDVVADVVFRRVAKPREALWTYVEINQCVGYTR